MTDQVNHPTHYTNHPSGIECIKVTQHMSFTLGNAFKYLFRAEAKNGDEDYRKALWYLDRGIKFRGGARTVMCDYPSVMVTVDHIAAADPRTEIARAMRCIGKAAFKHIGTSDLECAVEEVQKWLKNSNG